MENTGFVKLYRRLRQWGWYKEPYTKVVYIHLLLLAQYGEAEFRGVTLRPGQAVATLQEIASDNGISVQNVRTAVKRLKATGEITVKRFPRFNIYTLNCYDSCRGGGQGGQPGGDRAATGEPHSHRGRTQDEEEEKESFIPPTVREVKEYCGERKNDVDPDKFVSFYSSNGWRVGKNPMRDWRASVRSWERNALSEADKRRGRGGAGRSGGGSGSGGYPGGGGAGRSGGLAGSGDYPGGGGAAGSGGLAGSGGYAGGGGAGRSGGAAESGGYVGGGRPDGLPRGRNVLATGPRGGGDMLCQDWGRLFEEEE